MFGERHYTLLTQRVQHLQLIQRVQDIIAILGVEELSDEQNNRKKELQKNTKILTQPLLLPENFGSNIPGQF